MVRGLKFLKDELSIIHRGMCVFRVAWLTMIVDVKPTNVLLNTRGEIKLCDVSKFVSAKADG
jgi:mitogen-activated protein kinase kinase